MEMKVYYKCEGCRDPYHPEWPRLAVFVDERPTEVTCYVCNKDMTEITEKQYEAYVSVKFGEGKDELA